MNENALPPNDIVVNSSIDLNIPLSFVNENSAVNCELKDVVSSNSSEYLLMVLNRHFAWLPWKQHIQQLTDEMVSQLTIIMMLLQKLYRLFII